MAIVTLETIKAHLNLAGLGDSDDALLTRMVAAAQNHIERLLGYAIETEYPPSEDEPPVSTVPPALVEAVCLLAAHWYENREATLVGVTAQSLPIGLEDIVREYRNYSFGVTDE